MSTLEFTRNDFPTIGVEIELQLVDAEKEQRRNQSESGDPPSDARRGLGGNAFC